MYPSETAACHSAPYDPFWTFFNPIRWRNLALLRTPSNIIFWIGKLKQIFGTKSPHSSAVRFLYCVANFSRAERCLAVQSRGFFCLLSGLQPSLFINLQMVFFPPTWPLSGRVSPFLLSFVQNSFSFLIKEFSVFPFFSCLQTPSFLDRGDHFTIQRSDFFSFLETSLTDKPVDLSIDAWALK